MYEFEFMKSLQKTDLKLAREFNKTCRYIDDLVTINNPSFAEFIPRIYPDSLKLNKENEDPKNATFLDTALEIKDNGSVRIFIYDKRDDFPFEINTYPYCSSNISIRNAINVYTSQLVRISRICNHVEDFHNRHLLIAERLHRNGFKKNKLIKVLKKFTKRHKDLLQRYGHTPKQNAQYIAIAYKNID
jgi:hypothetical protein